MKNDPRNRNISSKTSIGGYKIEKIENIKELSAHFYSLIHEPTGARHIHISRDDPENAFAVGFKTIPADNTGVAHILEHTVLCGSKKYPVRDPFFSMLKRSLNTFMNALTASDWTLYPFATPNEKDFYNLMSVYTDAVFFPLLDPLSFRQEGWRIDFEPDPNDKRNLKPVFQGVVYNEMKGAMSSPDQILARSLLASIFPQTPYRFNSGGDPEAICTLNHEDLVLFHKTHYHPSNAYFYTYGDIPLEKHLAFIENEVLSHFSKAGDKIDMPDQPRWDTPQKKVAFYPADPSKPVDEKAQVSVAWLLSDIRDPYEILAESILEEVLLGNPGAPLYRALIESGLGRSLCDGAGYDSEYKQAIFSCGLKDIRPENENSVEDLILDTLARLAADGIDSRLVDAAIHQIIFHHKEVTNSPYPYGLKLLFKFFADWIHDGNPLLVLKFDELLSRLKYEIHEEHGLERRIKKCFLENPHRVRLLLLPDKELLLKKQQEEEIRLNRIIESAGEKELRRFKEEAIKLARLQEADEDLSCLPYVEKKDITPGIRTLKPERIEANGAMWIYPQPTSGIFYVHAALGAGRIEPGLRPWLPFFCYAMTRAGTATTPYAELARRIDASTGGLGFAVRAENRFNMENHKACVLPMVYFSAKSISEKIPEMFSILSELLCESNFSDSDRILRLLFEYRTGLEASIIHNAHRLAISLAARNFTASAALNEEWHGIHQLLFIRKKAEQAEKGDIQAVQSALRKIAENLFTADNIKIALTGESNDLQKGESKAMAMTRSLGKNGKNGFVSPELMIDEQPCREMWTTAADVSYVAKVVPAMRLGHPDAPALALLSRILKSVFLHREIREKGGAYGGLSLYQAETGLFCFASYRDPHVLNTLKAFSDAVSQAKKGMFLEENVEEAVIQICSDIDAPLTPADNASKAFMRELVGLDDKTRDEFKTGLLLADRQRIIEAAQIHLADEKPYSICVITNQEKAESVNKRISTPMIIKEI